MDDVKNLLQEITAAEAEADQMMADAMAEARRVNLEADAEAIKMADDARNAFKEEKKRIIESAEAEAEKEYERIIALGNAKAEELRSGTDTAEAVKTIAEAFINRYGSR